MKTYTVRYAVTNYYEVTIQANNIDEAWDESVDASEDDIEMGNWCSSDWEVVEIEPLFWDEEDD